MCIFVGDASLQDEVLAKNRRVQAVEGDLEEVKRELRDLRRQSGQHDRWQQEVRVGCDGIAVM